MERMQRETKTKNTSRVLSSRPPTARKTMGGLIPQDMHRAFENLAVDIIKNQRAAYNKMMSRPGGIIKLKDYISKLLIEGRIPLQDYANWGRLERLATISRTLSSSHNKYISAAKLTAKPEQQKGLSIAAHQSMLMKGSHPIRYIYTDSNNNLVSLLLDQIADKGHLKGSYGSPFTSGTVAPSDISKVTGSTFFLGNHEGNAYRGRFSESASPPVALRLRIPADRLIFIGADTVAQHDIGTKGAAGDDGHIPVEWVESLSLIVDITDPVIQNQLADMFGKNPTLEDKNDFGHPWVLQFPTRQQREQDILFSNPDVIGQFLSFLEKTGGMDTTPQETSKVRGRLLQHMAAATEQQTSAILSPVTAHALAPESDDERLTTDSRVVGTPRQAAADSRRFSLNPE